MPSESVVPNLPAVFAALPSASLVVDETLTIVAATDAYLTGLVVGRDTPVGKRLVDVFPDGDPSNTEGPCGATIRRSIESALASGTRNELPMQRAEPHLRRSNHPVVDSDGRVLYVIHQIADVTREVELEQARSHAAAMSAAKSLFLSSMSHELRTPPNAILGFAQLLEQDRRETLSRRHSERLAQILKGGEHLVRLLDDVLDLSRIEMNGIQMSVEAVDVLDVLSDAIELLAPSAQGAGVRLEMAPGAVGAPLVNADRTRYTQILTNLGSNAIKYNRPGGTVIFRVDWVPEEDAVFVYVADTGLGIPRDKQPRIFQPFERAGRELGPIEGSGIGLALSKRLAELMAGDVGFTSAEGEGSEFWVRMTVPDERRRTSGPPPAQTPLEPSRSGTFSAFPRQQSAT